MLCQLGIRLLEDILMLLKHSLSLKILVNKEPWCFHCNQKFSSLFKTKRKDSKVLKENISKANNQKKEKHQNIKARKPTPSKNKQFIYVQKEKQKKTKILPIPEILKLED